MLKYVTVDKDNVVDSVVFSNTPKGAGYIMAKEAQDYWVGSKQYNPTTQLFEKAVPKKNVYSKLEFINKIGQDVFGSILVTKKSDIQVEMAYEAFMLAEYINVADPMVSQFLGLLVIKGIITEAQKVAILT